MLARLFCRVIRLLCRTDTGGNSLDLGPPAEPFRAGERGFVTRLREPEVDPAKRLVKLEQENVRLNRLVTDLSLDNSIIK